MNAFMEVFADEPEPPALQRYMARHTLSGAVNQARQQYQIDPVQPIAQPSKFPAKNIYASFRQDGTVKVQMFVTPNAAMCHIRHFGATLIELRRITGNCPDGIVLAQAK